MTQLLAVCREAERAAGICGAAVAGGSGPQSAPKRRRFELAGWFINAYWETRQGALQDDVRTFIGNTQPADAELSVRLVDFLYCDGELESAPAPALQSLSSVATGFFASPWSDDPASWLARAEGVRVLLGMKLLLDMRSFARLRAQASDKHAHIHEYAAALRGLALYKSPALHLHSGVEGYFLLLRELIRARSALAATGSDVADWLREHALRLMGECAGIHMQSFVALEELLTGQHAAALELVLHRGRQRLALAQPAGAHFRSLHDACANRDNTRDRLRIGCPAFFGAGHGEMVRGLHSTLAIPMLLAVEGTQ